MVFAKKSSFMFSMAYFFSETLSSHLSKSPLQRTLLTHLCHLLLGSLLKSYIKLWRENSYIQVSSSYRHKHTIKFSAMLLFSHGPIRFTGQAQRFIILSTKIREWLLLWADPLEVNSPFTSNNPATPLQ